METAWIFRPAKFHRKKYEEPTQIFQSAKLYRKSTWKWRGNSSKFDLRRIDAISTWIRRGVPVEKLDLQAPEAMKLFGSMKELIDKTRNGENVTSLEIIEVVYSNVIQQMININESMKYYTLLRQINLMLIY